MADAFDVRTAFHAAEMAAGTGDLATAEVCLREALRLQSEQLGANNPTLAPTLNNLAVICERVGKLTDAEGFYRRAYAVAKAGHDASDPLVTTSRDNLQAFLEAYRLPSLDAAPAGWATIAEPAAKGARPAARRTSPLLRAVAWTTAVALVGLTAVLWWPSGAEDAIAPAPEAAVTATAPPIAEATTPASAPAAEVAPAAAPPPATPPVEPQPTVTERSLPPPEPASASPSASPVSPAPTPTTPAPAPAPSTPSASVTGVTAGEAGDDEAAVPIRVVDSRLCRDLSTAGGWTCTAPADPVSPGRLSFLTRIDAASPARIVHAWIHEGRTVQSVTLRIRPSAGAGFRTYSRQTIDASRPGNWRVELRTPQGAVLATVPFVVR